MASNHPQDCCAQGVKYEGTPPGGLITIASKYTAYLSVPPTTTASHPKTALLILPDVLGIWLNSKLIADDFASHGYLTMVLDIYNGDPMTLNSKGIDWKTWMNEGSDGKNPHTKEFVDPIVEEGIKWLKEEKEVERIGGVGYCFGAKYVARHYKTGFSVGYMAHPSFIDEEELSSITGPLSISAAEKEVVFPAEKRHRSEEILKETGKPYQMTLYSGVAHGFAVRCDLKNRYEKWAKEQAFGQGVRWFDEWLVGGC